MTNNINELISQASQQLAELGYKPSTIQRFERSWKKIRRWCLNHHTDQFGTDQEQQLLKEMGLDENILSPGNRSLLRYIRSLLTLNEHGTLPAFSRPQPEAVPTRFSDVFTAYISHLQQRGLASATQRGTVSVIRKFLIGLTINDFADLSMSDVTAHIESCSWMTPQTRATLLYTIRAFTRWAAEQGFCHPNVAAAMAVIPGHKHASLPSAYAVDEVARMVAATTSQCPKRNRAMLLLAAVLGIRAGDIRALRLDNIDWRTRQIRFAQSKTDHPVTLPLPDEVMLALADYLRNERPKSDDKHVFLHHRAPHGSFDNVANPFHYVATTAFAQASVNTAGKHHGMHALRHSTATNMLADGTTYPVISAILGHTNSNTTRRYMAIDVEQLRSLSLELPRG